MTLRLARTNAEEHLYMEINACACGETQFDPPSTVVLVEDVLASRFSGACPRCGTQREFLFRMPEEIVLPNSDRIQFGVGEQASELIDPGEWLMVADEIASRVPADVDAVAEELRQQVRMDLTAAVAALDEVLKFVPPDGDRVPEEAFWTDRGKAVYHAEPGRFRRLRLTARCAAYLELIDAWGVR
jgi:hypothetical protein